MIPVVTASTQYLSEFKLYLKPSLCNILLLRKRKFEKSIALEGKKAQVGILTETHIEELGGGGHT